MTSPLTHGDRHRPSTETRPTVRREVSPVVTFQLGAQWGGLCEERIGLLQRRSRPQRGEDISTLLEDDDRFTRARQSEETPRPTEQREAALGNHAEVLEPRRGILVGRGRFNQLILRLGQSGRGRDEGVLSIGISRREPATKLANPLSAAETVPKGRARGGTRTPTEPMLIDVGP